jgi:hypothetical protein
VPGDRKAGTNRNGHGDGNGKPNGNAYAYPHTNTHAHHDHAPTFRQLRYSSKPGTRAHTACR